MDQLPQVYSVTRALIAKGAGVPLDNEDSNEPFGLLANEWRDRDLQSARETTALIDEHRRRHTAQLQESAGDSYERMVGSPDAAEEFLTDDNPDIRYVALSLLNTHWAGSAKLRSLCMRMSLSDPSPSVRESAVWGLVAPYAGTCDADVMVHLASIVQDDAEDVAVRRAAYVSLFHVREKFSPVALDLAFPDDVDWAFVNLCAARAMSPPDPHMSNDPLAARIATSSSPEARAAFKAFQEYKKGMDSFLKRNYREAREHFAVALAHCPNAITHCMRGCALGNLGDIAAAIADFNAAIAIKADEPIYYRERAEAYRRKGLVDLADADDRVAEELGEKKGT